jgi:hypothetical protein
MKLFFVLALLASLLLTSTGMTQSETASPRMVMTWVPPYAIEKCRARLNEDVGGLGPKNVLTHLALQFWLPTRSGGVEKTAKYGAITDATILEFRDWAHLHGIRAMLCVYNSVDSWDWSLAQAAFAEHREQFVRALVAETERLGLDGIDIDLEGSGDFQSSKEPFLAFIRELASRLHALHRQLTVDSFAYKWNAPNQTWWSDLFPLVDGINTMGYESIGAKADDWRAYAAQKSVAGSNAAKLLIGVPGAKSDWLGSPVAEHMDWITRDSSVGVAIWDAQFGAPYWQTPAAWQSLTKMRGGR